VRLPLGQRAQAGLNQVTERDDVAKDRLRQPRPGEHGDRLVQVFPAHVGQRSVDVDLPD
jgi:hypothetical protein